MQTLSNELRAVIGRRLELARPSEIIKIASTLCGVDEARETESVNTEVKPRFELVDDYGVRDRSTGLVWTREPVAGGKRSWKASMDAASKVTFGGHTWRAPTIQEQLSLVDYERCTPAIDPIFVCERDAWFWTSTVDAESPSEYSWYVSFYNGFSNRSSQGGSGFVRAVRVGQF
jgi:hypothetical protein